MFYEDDVMVVEPVACRHTTVWNPNVPSSATQEEWREHFMQIEDGQFYSLEQATHIFDIWKKDYLTKNL